MSGSMLAFVVLCLGISKLPDIEGENISNGKYARQSSTHTFYVPGRALVAHANYESLTQRDNPSWWELDLRGYFIINNITVTASTYNNAYNYMQNAYVEVMDKDVSLCSDVQVVWCGAVSSTIASGEDFTFTCNATFPVRFVRVTRRSTEAVLLRIGHVDVQGQGSTKPYRSYYKPSWNKKVSKPFLTTSAMTAGDCGIVCHKHYSCIDFSYSATAPTDENCLLTDKAWTSHPINDTSWTTYTIYCM